MSNKQETFTLVKDDHEVTLEKGFSKEILVYGPIAMIRHKDYEWGLFLLALYLLLIYLTIVDKRYEIIIMGFLLHLLFSFIYTKMFAVVKVTYRGYRPKTEEDLNVIQSMGLFNNMKF